MTLFRCISKVQIPMFQAYKASFVAAIQIRALYNLQKIIIMIQMGIAVAYMSECCFSKGEIQTWWQDPFRALLPVPGTLVTLRSTISRDMGLMDTLFI